MESHTQIVSLDVPRRTETHAPSISLECVETPYTNRPYGAWNAMHRLSPWKCMKGHTQIVSLDVPRRTEHHVPNISLECLENQTPPDPRCMKDILRSPPPLNGPRCPRCTETCTDVCFDLGG